VSDAAADKRRIAELEAENRELKETIKRLVARVEELERAGKRQAAPFSKGKPKQDPQKPGRKPGDEYGDHHSRAHPEQIDEEIDVPLKRCCPFCGEAAVCETHVAEQFQVEVPRPKPVHRRFSIHVGACGACGRRVQPRHPLQTTDALGAVKVTIGSDALSLASSLKTHGLSFGKIQGFFETAFGLTLERSTLVRAFLRLGRRLRPSHDELVEALPAAPVVNADETGWKLAGLPAWAWAFVTKGFTVYWIDRSRGSDVLGKTIGFDFPGLLGRDGYAPYAKLEVARAQSCLAHFFVRAGEVLATALRGAARFAHLVVAILRAALALRDRREDLSQHGFAVARGRVEARMDRLLEWRPSHAPNEKFRRHLARQRPHLFTFLYEPSIEATNWPGEQAMRPLVVIRRNCGGGNRTAAGAEATQVIHSIARTCWQQALDPLQFFGLAFRLPFTVRFGLANGPSG